MGVLFLLYFNNMMVNRVHKGNDFKSADKSFNQVIFLSEAICDIQDPSVNNSTSYMGYRCSTWFCSPVCGKC